MSWVLPDLGRETLGALILHGGRVGVGLSHMRPPRHLEAVCTKPNPEKHDDLSNLS